MQRKFLSAVLVLAVSLFSMGFINDTGKAAGYECKIMIGVGYKQTKCGGDNGLSVSEAVDYFGVASSYTSYDEMRKTILSTIQKFNNIEEKDISFSSSSKPYAVVISYAKPISGWNCTVTRMAVGFGDSLAAAEQDAENKKNNDANGSVGYRVIKIYTC